MFVGWLLWINSPIDQQNMTRGFDESSYGDVVILKESEWRFINYTDGILCLLYCK